MPYKKEYYYKNGNNYYLVNYVQITDNTKTDKPKIIAPQFDCRGISYYEYLGYEKASSLKKGNVYYVDNGKISIYNR